MAEERLRRNLDLAFDPGPNFPSRLWLSRTIAALDEEATPRSGRLGRLPTSRNLLWRGGRLAAVPLLVAVTVAATAAFFALHRSFGPSPAHFPPFQVRGIGAPVCAGKCTLNGPVFVSASVGWLIESASPVDPNACDPNCHATSVVFRTGDGGLSWAPSFTFNDHLGVGRIVTSPDGAGVLVIAGWGTGSGGGPSLFHSGDGGATWQSFSLPPAPDVLNCPPANGPPKGGVCVEESSVTQVFFLNPREGWALAAGASSAAASLYRTLDSGDHWSLSQIDITSLHRLVGATGLSYPSDVDGSLPGQLQFQTSSVGWLIPYYYAGTKDAPPFMFRTGDGGSTWQLRTISVAGQSQSGLYGLQFFNAAEGIVRIDKDVYATGDGGNSWRGPFTLPAGTIQFLDATHWVGLPVGGGWMTTNDAGLNWVVTPPATQQAGSAPVADHGLPRIVIGGGFKLISQSTGWATVLLSAAPDGGPGGTALYKTSDGGANWSPATLPELEIPGDG
jgi:hypothetical protein